MTRDEILNMPAGQDMDLLVAEEVLKLDSVGWNERFFHNRAKFSTDIRAAWEVVMTATELLGLCLKAYCPASVVAFLFFWAIVRGGSMRDRDE